MLDDVGQLPDLVARVHAHALLSVHAAGDPDVVGVTHLVHRDDPRTERTEARGILCGPEARAGGDLTLLRVAAGEVIQQGDAGDVIECVLALRAESGLAEDEDELRLVVQMRDARRSLDLRVLPHKTGIQLDEASGLLRSLADEIGAFQLGKMRPVVLADAEELARVGHRREQAHVSRCAEHLAVFASSGLLDQSSCALQARLAEGQERLHHDRAHPEVEHGIAEQGPDASLTGRGLRNERAEPHETATILRCLSSSPTGYARATRSKARALPFFSSRATAWTAPASAIRCPSSAAGFAASHTTCVGSARAT